MAAGPFIFPDKAKLNLFSLGMLGLTSNFKLALVGSSWTPAPSTDEVFGDITGELATANGYTSGGAALTGVALTQSGGTVKFTAAPVVWTATGGSIAAWRRAVLYYDGTLSGKVKPLIAYFLGDLTPADIPVTTSGNTLTVTMNGLGILSA